MIPFLPSKLNRLRLKSKRSPITTEMVLNLQRNLGNVKTSEFYVTNKDMFCKSCGMNHFIEKKKNIRCSNCDTEHHKIKIIISLDNFK